MAYLWVGLVVVFGKDQRCEKKMICEWLRGNSAKILSRLLSLFLAITWPTNLQI